MRSLESLLALKDEQGILDGKDAVDFVDYVRAGSQKWTADAEKELTAFMLGLPVKASFQFVIVAGRPVAPATVVFDPSLALRRNLRKRQKQAKTMRARIRKTGAVAA